jgi:hypothetical protein
MRRLREKLSSSDFRNVRLDCKGLLMNILIEILEKD